MSAVKNVIEKYSLKTNKMTAKNEKNRDRYAK